MPTKSLWERLKDRAKGGPVDGPGPQLVVEEPSPALQTPLLERRDEAPLPPPPEPAAPPPAPMTRIPAHVPHQEHGHLMYAVGDEVEFDAEPQTGTPHYEVPAGGLWVDAEHVAGPPRRLTRAQVDAGESAYHMLFPGDVRVRHGATGKVLSIGARTVIIKVDPQDVEIREGALSPAEKKFIARSFAFGFDRDQVIPLKEEKDRVWADAEDGDTTRVAAPRRMTEYVAMPPDAQIANALAERRDAADPFYADCLFGPVPDLKDVKAELEALIPELDVAGKWMRRKADDAAIRVALNSFVFDVLSNENIQRWSVDLQKAYGLPRNYNALSPLVYNVARACAEVTRAWPVRVFAFITGGEVWQLSRRPDGLERAVGALWPAGQPDSYSFMECAVPAKQVGSSPHEMLRPEKFERLIDSSDQREALMLFLAKYPSKVVRNWNAPFAEPREDEIDEDDDEAGWFTPYASVTSVDAGMDVDAARGDSAAPLIETPDCDAWLVQARDLYVARAGTMSGRHDYEFGPPVATDVEAVRAAVDEAVRLMNGAARGLLRRFPAEAVQVEAERLLKESVAGVTWGGRHDRRAPFGANQRVLNALADAAIAASDVARSWPVFMYGLILQGEVWAFCTQPVRAREIVHEIFGNEQPQAFTVQRFELPLEVVNRVSGPLNHYRYDRYLKNGSEAEEVTQVVMPYAKDVVLSWSPTLAQPQEHEVDPDDAEAGWFTPYASGAARHLAQQVTVGPPSFDQGPSALGQGTPPTTSTTPPAAPPTTPSAADANPAAWAPLKLRNDELFQRAVAAGAREEYPGAANMGNFGWIWRSSTFGQIKDPARYSTILDDLEKRVGLFERRPRRGQVDRPFEWRTSGNNWYVLHPDIRMLTGSLPSDHRPASLAHVEVEPEAQGCGVGKAALAFALEQLRRLGVSEVLGTERTTGGEQLVASLERRGLMTPVRDVVEYGHTFTLYRIAAVRDSRGDVELDDDRFGGTDGSGPRGAGRGASTEIVARGLLPSGTAREGWRDPGEVRVAGASIAQLPGADAGECSAVERDAGRHDRSADAWVAHDHRSGEGGEQALAAPGPDASTGAGRHLARLVAGGEPASPECGWQPRVAGPGPASGDVPPAGASAGSAVTLREAAAVDIPPKVREACRSALRTALGRLARRDIERKVQWRRGLPREIASAKAAVETVGEQLAGLTPGKTTFWDLPQLGVRPAGGRSNIFAWCRRDGSFEVAHREGQEMPAGGPALSLEQATAQVQAWLARQLAQAEKVDAALPRDDADAREFLATLPRGLVEGVQSFDVPLDLTGWRYAEDAPPADGALTLEVHDDKGREHTGEGSWRPGAWTLTLHVGAWGRSDARAFEQTLTHFDMVLEHELTHVAQTLLQETKGLRQPGGLPSKTWDEAGVTNERQRGPHTQRDIEFYPILAEELADFNRSCAENEVEGPARDALARSWVESRPKFKELHQDIEKWQKMVRLFLMESRRTAHVTLSGSRQAMPTVVSKVLRNAVEGEWPEVEQNLAALDVNYAAGSWIDAEGHALPAFRWFAGWARLSALPTTRPINPENAQYYSTLDFDEAPAVTLIYSRGRLRVVDGEHRIAAARLAKRDVISAYLGVETTSRSGERLASGPRDIVVWIPAGRLEEVEREEAETAQREAQGETGLGYYWQMGRLPKEDPRRIYFAWDGAVRAYHDVTHVDRAAGRIYMTSTIHDVPAEPCAPFRGFKYREGASELHGEAHVAMDRAFMGAWVSPDGQSYEVAQNHAGWALARAEEEGLSSTETGDREEDARLAMRRLLEAGWIRVSGPTGIQALPTASFDRVIQLARESSKTLAVGDVIYVDASGDYSRTVGLRVMRPGMLNREDVAQLRGFMKGAATGGGASDSPSGVAIPHEAFHERRPHYGAGTFAPYDVETGLPVLEDYLRHLPAGARDDVMRSMTGAVASGELVAVHSLSASNLAHAQEVGGLIAPSIAIINSAHAFDKFGDITLVAPLSMVDPKTTPIFDADIYSPRYPNVRFKPQYKAISKFMKAHQPYAARTDGYLYDLEHNVEKEGAEGALNMRTRPLLQLAFLEQVKGMTVEDVTRPKAVEPAWAATSTMTSFLTQNPYKTNDVQLGDPYWQQLSTAARAAIEEHWQNAKDKDGQPLDEDTKRYLINADVEHYLNEAGQLYLSRGSAIPRAHAAVGQTEVDPYAYRDKLEELVKPYEAEFEAWARAQLQPLQGERYLTSEGGRNMKYTPENVLKLMTKKTRGGENFNYGLGSLRALGTRRFRTLEQMTAAGDKLVSHDEMEVNKETMNNRFFELVNRLGEYHPASGSFGFADTVISALGESFKRGHVLWNELKRDGFEGVPSDLVRELEEFKRELIDQPTEYFEAKPQRIVPLNEFVGGVVPKSDTASAQILEANGLAVVFYNPEKPQTRVTALKKLRRTVKNAYEGEASPSGVARSAHLREGTGAARPNAVARSAHLREGKEPGSSVAIVVRVPAPLAEKWPDVEDSGPPHVTCCFLKPAPTDAGDGPAFGAEDFGRIAEIVARVAEAHAPFWIAFERGVSWLTSDNTKQMATGKAEVAYKEPTAPGFAAIEALHHALVTELRADGYQPAVRDEFKAHATLGYFAERAYDGPVPDGECEATGLEVWGWPGTVVCPFGEEAEDEDKAAAGTRVAGRKRPKSKQRRRKFVRPTWYLREGSNVAWNAARAHPGEAEATAVWLRPEAHVLHVSEAELARRSEGRTAAHAGADPFAGNEGEAGAGGVGDGGRVDALIEAVRLQAEALKMLSADVAKLLEAGGSNYDAIQTEERLIVLDPSALEKAPPRQRWLS